jgi:CheY-like chemotaxis protein
MSKGLIEVTAPLGGDRRPSVLIVDDDENVRQVLRLLFEFEDFDVAGEACSGVEAVPLALKYDPDFIILDFLLPGMAGDKTASLMRTLVPQARIIAFSAILAEKPAWADSYLNKDRITEIAPLLTSVMSR